MANLYPSPTNHITTTDPTTGKSKFHSSATHPSLDPLPTFRVHYVYSTTSTPAGGPPLKNNADLENYEQIAKEPKFGPNPNGEKGAMHTTSTIDYIFILDGSIELGLESGETRVLKKGDSAVQRGTAHWWRNTSKTEPVMMAAVSVGVEGAVEDEMRIAAPVEEG
ncbi:hypothetical protein V493_06105 [Pseudogymnoascus sp. VKM F-4281 (FW-2241)]|nr:hypothetical protein V493_06105 [Pseudogymnoascus sp. VKM F-4281 (FW-2241)]